MAEMTAVKADASSSLKMLIGSSAVGLEQLAAILMPIRLGGGDIVTRQGEVARSFVLIASGAVEVHHRRRDGTSAIATLGAGQIVGEIALLRNAARTATVAVTDDIVGYIGDVLAFQQLLAIPNIAEKLVPTARQRLAELTPPIPVRAHDGAELMLRPIVPSDGARIAAGEVNFSPETLYQRFHSARKLTAALVRRLCEIDYVDHFAWVITDGDDGPVVAGGRFVRDKQDHTLAEVALTVADAYQGRGIGAIMCSALAAAAQMGGIERFTARTLAGNGPARTLINPFGGIWQCDEPGVVATVTDIASPKQSPLNGESLTAISDVVHDMLHTFDGSPQAASRTAPRGGNQAHQLRRRAHRASD